MFDIIKIAAAVVPGPMGGIVGGLIGGLLGGGKSQPGDILGSLSKVFESLFGGKSGAAGGAQQQQAQAGGGGLMDLIKGFIK